MFINDDSSHHKKQKISQSAIIFKGPYILSKANGEKLSLQPKDTVQLIDVDVDLLTIKRFEQVIEQYWDSTLQSDKIKVKTFIYGTGYKLFKSCNDFGGFLSDSTQEVYEMYNVKDEEPQYSVDKVLRKVTIVRTNCSYPELEQKKNRSRFVCRYKRPEKDALIRLSQQQADKGPVRVDDKTMRDTHTNTPFSTPKKRYTFGDAFCGIGGCSAGAKMAGLRSIWAFDADESVCDIYSQNFPHCDVWIANATDFIALNRIKRTDVLHLSPPCQTFSQAHTIAGKNDDSNSAAFFVIDKLLEKCHPRVVTLENVPGLENMHNMFFQSGLRQFLDAGYSIRWRILKAHEFGVPQIRRRLFIIASCPGQPLPEFPQPTHGPSTGVPYVTLGRALENINPTDRLHDVRYLGTPRHSRIDLDKPFPGTVMTNNSSHVFPGGSRLFTKRELARVQTFSDAHIQGGTNIEKNIGNAVPPKLARTVFESIVACLRKTDENGSAEVFELD